MLVVPFLAFLLIILFGKRMPGQGAEIAIGAMAIDFIYALALFIRNATSGIIHEEQFEIAHFGFGGGRQIQFEWGWVVDGLSTMMFLVVSRMSCLPSTTE